MGFEILSRQCEFNFFLIIKHLKIPIEYISHFNKARCYGLKRCIVENIYQFKFGISYQTTTINKLNYD
jgi:hypothetical protein